MNKLSLILPLIILIALAFLGFNFFSNDTNDSVAASALFSQNDPKTIPKFPTIVFHELTTNPEEVLSTVITADDFSRYLQILKNNGYTTITDVDLYNYIYLKKPLPQNPIHITFDDGYESNYTLAFPILKELNMKATIFPITAAIDDPNYVSDRKILSWEQIKEMSDSGLVSIQNHSDKLHHKTNRPGYPQSIMVSEDIDESQNKTKYLLHKDLNTASDKIESNTGKRVISMSYPFGSYDERAMNSAVASGILFAYTLSSTLTDFSTQNILELGRINIPPNLSDVDFLNLIRGN